MSERGKYWNPKKYEITPEEKTPISVVGDRSVDSDRPTIVAPETIQRMEHTTEEPVVQEKSIKDVQDSWRRTKLLSLAWVSTVIGIGGGSYYMYATEQGPFAPKDTVVETAPTASAKEEPKEEAPWEIKNEEDLKHAFKKYQIPSVTVQDFDFETKKQEYHAKAMIYKQTIVGNKALNVKDQYAWVGVNDKILETEDSAVLIAVHLISDYSRQNAETVVNSGPGAHPYITKMIDEKDPNIIYFYFNKCSNRTNEQALARVRIQSPANHNKHLWFQSFHIPKCQDETNGVESDEPIQE